jgi:nucleoside-diphosphate-sugar epimerase
MKIFVTGASGYIGGSVSQRLLEAGHQVIGLVRSAEKAKALSSLGIEPLLGSLDDSEALREGATRADATINAANSDHYFAIQTLIESLAGSGKVLLHTSGSSIVCDDAMGQGPGQAIYDDDAPFQPMLHRIPRIQIDRMVRSAGVTRGIRAAVICPTMIYGVGLGLGKESDQIPRLMEQATTQGKGIYLGAGLNVWSNVFIGDVADLFLLALERAPSGATFFAENGENSMREVAAAISKHLGFGGETASWSIDDAIGELGGFGRVALATNARVRSTNARRLLGWSPKGASLPEALEQGL